MREEEKKKLLELGRIKFEEARIHGFLVEKDFDVFMVGFTGGIMTVLKDAIIMERVEIENLQ